jgi:hypothetical protein
MTAAGIEVKSLPLRKGASAGKPAFNTNTRENNLDDYCADLSGGRQLVTDSPLGRQKNTGC